MHKQILTSGTNTVQVRRVLIRVFTGYVRWRGEFLQVA